MKRVEFLSLDTLFFRDGSPFNANELQSGAQTCFPPSPQTLVGAIRASAASELGWNGQNFGSNWDDCCREALGTGNDLGPLQFRGPFMFCDGEPIFPIPADLLGKPATPPDDSTAKLDPPTDLLRLSPGRTQRECDLGSVRLPEGPRDGVTGRKQLHGEWWMNQAGLNAVVRGGCPSPEDLTHRSELWKVEPRVGISRDPDSRTTREQALYAPRHVRPQSRVYVNLFVEGLTQQATDGMSASRVQAVGGESRGCWLNVSDADPPLPAMPEWSVVDNMLCYAVLVLTPLAASSPPLPNTSFLGLPGVVVSACLPRPQFWGGWDSLENRPLPLTPHLAPGSIVFLEADSVNAASLPQWHGASIGEKTEWGFGVISLGNWNS